MLLTDLLYKFELSLKRRELSPQTVLNYHWALHDLIYKAMRPARLVQVSDLTREVLEEWQDSQIERAWAPRSRGLSVTATRQFIKFGIEAEYIIDPKQHLNRALAKVKQPEPEPHPIPEEDLAKIHEYLLPLTSDMTITQLRDRALFCFILSTGARVKEALQPTRIDFAMPTVIQKGGTKKVLGVTPKAIEIVGDYLTCREDDSPVLWVIHAKRRHLEPMNPADVRLVWKHMSKRLGLSYWTTHAIRHTTATVLLAANIDHLVIAEHLGHHGVGTIANYAKVGERGRQKVLGALDGQFQLPEHPPQEAA